MKVFRNTIILLVILVGLLGYYYYNKGAKKAVPSKNIFSISKNDIKSVDIKNNGNEILLNKSGNTFMLEKPLKYKADTININDIIDNLARLKYSREFSSGDLKKYGLNKENSSINISSTNGKTEYINIGNKSPVGNSYYVKTSKTPNIYVVDASSLDTFQLNGDYVFNYLSKDIYTISKDKINDIIYNNQSGVHEIKNGKGGKWYYKGKTLNKNVIDKLLDDITILSASGIDQNKQINKNNFSLSLTIAGDNKQENIKFFKDTNSNYYIEKGNVYIGLYITNDQMSNLITDLNGITK